MQHRGEKPAWQKRLANERIKRLFELAEEDFRKPENSRKYVKLARKIAMRYNIRIAMELRRKFCKKCSSYLKHGVNASLRTGKGIIITKCLVCGNVRRVPMKKH